MLLYIKIVNINDEAIPIEAMSEGLTFFPRIKSIMMIIKAKKTIIISGVRDNISLKLIIW